MHWFSSVLGRQVSTWAIVPDTGKPPWPVFYLLHGLSDDHTIWLRRTRIESYISGEPIMIVMPDGGRSFYTDNDQGPAYAQHIAVELPTYIENTFQVRTDRAGRCIGGLSMGGYGALRLALGFPDRFVSATSHSGALLHGTRADKGWDTPEWTRVFGKKRRGSAHDLLALASKAARSRKNLPAMRIDCGTEDFLLPQNREFHDFLKKHKLEHEYHEYPGGHTWEYWDLHVREAIKFHAKVMGVAKP